MKILLANPRGFCAGVDRAIEVVEKALIKHNSNVYVRNEVVHNKFVVENLKKKGAIFINDLADVPLGSVVIFSAHGVSKLVRNQAKGITDIIYDATCPLVTKVHKEVIRRANNEHQVVLIGHKGHPEVEGTLGQADSITLLENISAINKLELSDNVSYITQTTLSVDDTLEIVKELKKKYPNIESPKKNDICYATQNRQNAVKNIMKNADILLVLGSNNSSNSNRLKEIATKMGKPSYLIDNMNQIKSHWLDGVQVVGVTAGASAPEVLVQEVVEFLQADEIIEVSGAIEDTNFAIPKELR